MEHGGSKLILDLKKEAQFLLPNSKRVSRVFKCNKKSFSCIYQLDWILPSMVHDNCELAYSQMILSPFTIDFEQNIREQI